MKQYKISAETNIGKRDKNEDNFFCNGVYKNISDDNFSCNFCVSSYTLNLAAVFDGVRETGNGEMSSYLGVELLGQYMEAIVGRKSFPDPEEILNSINRYICLEAKKLLVKMKSRAVLWIYENNNARIFNLGARAYLYRNHLLEQVNEDRMTCCLGSDENGCILRPSDSGWFPVTEGDIFLLCNASLTALITDEEIADILGQNMELKEKRKLLLQKTMLTGGDDNVTIVLIESEE